jgi:hypothetical protein
MANLICRNEWGGDYDPNKDDYRSSGLYEADNTKCYFLLDNGVLEGQVSEFRVYRWDGHSM